LLVCAEWHKPRPTPNSRLLRTLEAGKIKTHGFFGKVESVAPETKLFPFKGIIQRAASAVCSETVGQFRFEAIR